MASHQTGEELTAGNINFANDITVITACLFDQPEVKLREFHGEVILIVRPDTEPRQRPVNKVDGVRAGR
jgi:hypothetical protein